jgi:hypothetical protein
MYTEYKKREVRDFQIKITQGNEPKLEIKGTSEL